jgi:DNA-binding NarL/FixJ family response regulator
MRLLIVEDFAIYREALAFICQGHLRQEVIGSTGSGVEAIRLARVLQPDVAFVDLGLDDMDGFDVSRRIAHDVPACHIFIVSHYCTQYVAGRLVGIPIRGFIDKNTDALDSFMKALKAAQEKRPYFSDSYLTMVREEMSDPISPRKVLTGWEQRILCLVGQGLDNQQICADLKISLRTVEGHRSIIERKLKIKGPAQLIAYAIRMGFALDRACAEESRFGHGKGI